MYLGINDDSPGEGRDALIRPCLEVTSRERQAGTGQAAQQSSS